MQVHADNLSKHVILHNTQHKAAIIKCHTLFAFAIHDGHNGTIFNYEKG